jgi:DNA-binding XRE family transcriptional regulator
MNDLDIIRIRKEFDLTQVEFAKLIGVDRRTIINYEQGTKIPESKVKLINMVIDKIGPAEIAEAKAKNKPEVKYVQDDNQLREIVELKDHIATFKQLINEKNIIVAYMQKEIERLQAENEAFMIAK